MIRLERQILLSSRHQHSKYFILDKLSGRKSRSDSDHVKMMVLAFLKVEISSFSRLCDAVKLCGDWLTW